MATLTVQEIFGHVAATVNLDQTQPAAGSTDYSLWVEFLQRAQAEWAEAYDWEELRKFFYPNITWVSNVSISLATISLPSDFRKVAAAPIDWSAGNSNGIPWPETLPEQRMLYASRDKYFFVMGDMNNGYNMLWNPGTLSSGASIEIQYFAIPASLASSGQVTACPDSQYLADRTIAYILEARFDNRYQSVEVKARERLLQMIENANAKKYSSYANPNFVITTTRRQGFRLGRD